MSEHEEQVAVIDWKNAHIYQRPCLEWLHSSLNGIPLAGSAKTRGRIINYMKAEGMTPGVPDLFLPFPAKGYHGLYIEMKKDDKGKPSEGQVDFLEYAEGVGYLCHLAGGAAHAVEAIKDYLELVCDCAACQLVEYE